MQRRHLLKAMGTAGLLGLASPRLQQAQEQAAKATRGMSIPKIKDIGVIECAPAGVRLTVVKITTDQDGLYGYGCATFTQRADLVKPAVEGYLKTFLMGKTKGRQAGMPVYQLAGGKCREAVDTYTHADGADYQATVENAKRFMAQGFRNVRVQVGVPGMAGYGSARGGDNTIKALHDKPVFEPAVYIRRALKLFEVCRKELGEEVELLHDVHERVSPNQAVQFAKDAEKFKLFFMEGPLAPEDIAYFRQIRQNCATPLAMGELFNSPHEWQPLISERLIDYIRVHVSQAGGFTPARKLAILAENFGVKTAWHGPGDVSPVGHMANVTLDLVSYNFGIQEYSPFNQRTQEIFSDCPVMKNGYLWVSEKPGWGIEVNEKEAAKSPFTPGRNNLNGGWGEIRRLDGTVIKQ